MNRYQQSQNIQFHYWLPYPFSYYRNCAEYIAQKVQSFIDNQDIKSKWSSTFNVYLPKKYLGYANDDEYLQANELTKNDVISNSITHVFKDIPQEDLEFLIQEFTVFTYYNKIQVIHFLDNTSLPMYYEIVNALYYIQSIEKLLAKYPQQPTNHLGTRHRASSLENIVGTQINALKHRIEHPFFALENQEEIDKTKFQIRFLELTLQDDFKFYPELFNFIRCQVGLDATVLGFTEHDQKTIYQILSFLNGLKTEKEELVKSVMIFLREQSRVPNDSSNQERQNLSDAILNIARFFFYDIFKKANDNNKKRLNQLTYNKDKPLQPYHIKTIIDDLMIYTYTYKNSYDFWKEMQTIFIQNITGTKNVFDPLQPEENQVSNFQKNKNLLINLKPLGITKQDIKTLLTLIDLTQIISEQNKLRVSSLKN